MHSTDDLFERLFSSVDTRAAFLADGLLSDSSAPAAGCSSFVIARQRRLAAKEKLLMDFDQNGVEDVHVSQCRAKCPAAMDVVPMDVKRDTLAFRSKINHSKNALAKVEEEDAPDTPRNMAIVNLYRRALVGNCMCSTRLESAIVEHQVSEQDDPQWDLNPWAFSSVIDSTTTAVSLTTAGDDTTRTTSDRTTTVSALQQLATTLERM